jgi:ribosomal protein S18 acetylase RimI-like enzyme
MLFATASLAKRIEKAEATLITEAARSTARRIGSDHVFIRNFGGGVAVHAGDGAPFNKVAGLGFLGVPEERQFAEIEQELAARNAPVQVEISTLGYPALARMLTERGYALVGFENVLGLALDGANPPDAATDPSIAILRTSADDDSAWLEAVLTGFLNPDTYDGPASHESFEADVLRRVYEDMASAVGFERYLARVGGEVAGGASLRIFEGVAQLCGAATLPAYRRRGIQSALLRYRLAESARRGCDVAVVTTTPGSKSQQNVQRAGFELLYARAILVKG